MSVMLHKCEANRRAGCDNESAQEVNETDVTLRNQKTKHNSRKEGEEVQMQAEATRIEPNLVEPGQEDIVLEVLQTAQGGNSSQIENLANEAENSSDSEICTKNRTLETSDRGRDPIPSEVGDDRRKKRKRGEQGGDVKENKNKIDKKIKAEVVEEKNIKDEAVQRLKILQKGVKSRQFFLSVRICAGNGFLDCWYLQGNQMGRLCSAVGSNAQNGDFSQNLRIPHW